MIIATDIVEEYEGGFKSMCDALGGAVEILFGEPQRNPTFNGVPYEEYLRSRHWRETRKRKLLRAAYQCQQCHVKGVKLDVHHLTYDRLDREDEGDLIVLCRICHTRAHTVQA